MDHVTTPALSRILIGVLALSAAVGVAAFVSRRGQASAAPAALFEALTPDADPLARPL